MIDQLLNTMPSQLVGAIPWYVIVIAAVVAIWFVKKAVKKIMGMIFGVLSIVKLIHYALVLYNMHG